MGERRYGKWAGNPKGKPEDTALCVENVYSSDRRDFIGYQCRRKRGFGPDGLYCRQHGRRAEKRRAIWSRDDD